MAFELTDKLIDELRLHPHLRGNLFGFHLFPDDLDFQGLPELPSAFEPAVQPGSDNVGGVPLGPMSVPVIDR